MRELAWDARKKKWVPKEEHEAKQRVMEAVRELLEELEFEIEIDPKMRKGRMKVKK